MITETINTYVSSGLLRHYKVKCKFERFEQAYAKRHYNSIVFNFNARHRPRTFPFKLTSQDEIVSNWTALYFLIK